MGDGIIFGQRGQGLLTGGRGMIFGRRGALDPDAPPIAGALANYDAYALDLDANDPVSEWADNASAGPATQETLAAQPTYAPDVLDSGTPGVEFSGSQYLFLPDVLKITGDQEVSVFSVVYLPGSSQGAIYAWADDTDAQRGLYLLRSSRNRVGLSYGGGGFSIGPDGSFPGDNRKGSECWGIPTPRPRQLTVPKC